MRVGLVTGRERIEFVEVEDPVPTVGGIVVDIAYCGICGTDIHAYTSGEPYAPAICGHEWVGTVSARGSGVRRLDEGERVVVAIGAACGRCGACRRGNYRHCSTVFSASIGRDALAPAHGGFAPHIAVDADRVVKVQHGIDDVAAALVEPATVALHAVRHSSLRIGDTAVVQGAGPIGLAVTQWTRIAGAARIVVIEPDERRRELALRLGASTALSPDEVSNDALQDLTGGIGADIVFECVGRPGAIQDAVDRCRRGGSVCLIGLADSSAVIHPATWLVKEINLSAALAYLHEEFDMVMAMMGDGRFSTEQLHTSTVPLADLGSAFADLASGTSKQIKVLVDPRR